MILHAKTTSERASSGQGGQWLDIEITDVNRDVIARLKVRKENEMYSIELFPVALPETLVLDVKGHGYRLKRKEIIVCPECSALDRALPNLHGKGRCQKHAKGNNQKDENAGDCYMDIFGKKCLTYGHKH